MSLLTALHQTLHDWSIRDGGIVIAVSGGADSMALLHAIAEVREPSLELVCVHVNQKLRGDESEADASFVERKSRDLGIECRVIEAPPDQDEVQRRGLEAAARIARYEALHSVRDRFAASWIATAHTIDDQAETVLLRLGTNAPPESLSAILPRTPDGIIRPLLGTRRDALRSWLSKRGIGYRFDSSNDDTRFLRNRIRHRLLPELARRDEHVVTHLASIAEQMRSIRESLHPVLRELSRRWKRDAVRSTVSETDMPVDGDLRRLMLLDEIRRLVPEGREVSSRRLATLTSELRTAGRLSLGSGLTAALDDRLFSLELEPVPPQHFSRTLECGQTIFVPECSASIGVRRVDHAGQLTDSERHRQIFALPEREDSPEFTARGRLPGDRFQPLGLGHEKKLKDVLIDRKVPARERDRIPLLVYRDQIVWIPGVEVSERFRVEPGRDLYEVRIDYEGSTEPESL